MQNQVSIVSFSAVPRVYCDNSVDPWTEDHFWWSSGLSTDKSYTYAEPRCLGPAIESQLEIFCCALRSLLESSIGGALLLQSYSMQLPWLSLFSGVDVAKNK